MIKTAFSIYDASAGSGKTFTLVKEYLKIILTSSKEDAYKNILAITFTNKAVGEMKSRIVENLFQFTLEEIDSKSLEMIQVISKETNLSLLDIRNKSKRIIKNIIHNYASFDILTIDKFTHKVIRAFAHDLNLPSTFEVTMETESLLQEAVESIISKAGEDEILTKLLIDFTMEKTDDDKSWDIARDFVETSKLLTNENNRNEIIHFKNKSVSEFVALKSKLIEESKTLEKECVELSKKAILLIERNNLNVKSFSRGVVFNYFIKISNGDFLINLKTFDYLEEGNRYAKTIPTSEKDSVDEIASDLIIELTEIHKKLEKYLLYKAFLKNITPLSLLNTVSQELEKIQEEQNMLSIAEFNAIIHNEIQNQPAPFIYERMGERFKHFFIDEFQDTSEMQWENLIPLIDNALSSEDLTGERGSLMLVGDPKQSIYRWRGGKAEQFIELSKAKNPFNNPDKSVFSLDTNFRSYSEIITFNNNFFNYLSESFENEDYKDLYANHSHQKENAKKGGYVSLSFIPKTEKSEEEDELTKTDLFLELTFETIKKVTQNGFEYRDIVILTRKRKAGIDVANFLTEQNIPIVSSETLMIEKASEVQLIFHVLKFLKNGNDKEAKANFLQYISKKVQKELPKHDFIEKGMSLLTELELEKWLQTFDITISFQNIRRKSLYEAVEIIISKFIKLEKTNAYVQYFLDIVLEKEIKNQFGISDFIDFWTDKASKFSIPSPEGNNAIRIMTIHKSKGLEFPVVIFPFAEESYSSGKKDAIWLDTDDENLNLPKILIDSNSSVENLGEKAVEIYHKKKQEELLDNINILYVALTRAEEQLYIISSMNMTSKGEVASNNMSSFFISYLISNADFNASKFHYEFGNVKKISNESKKLKKLNLIPLINTSLQPETIKIAQREALMWGTKQQDSIEYGNIIHEILSLINYKEDISLAITKAIENGLITKNDKNKVLVTIQSIINHPDLQLHFSSENKILNEQTIIQKEGKTLIPDRISINNQNQIFLLDYKTGVFLTKHVKQLETYENALQKMNFEVVKKTLVYIGEQIEIKNI